MADLAVNFTWNFQPYNDILIVNNGGMENFSRWEWRNFEGLKTIEKKCSVWTEAKQWDLISKTFYEFLIRELYQMCSCKWHQLQNMRLYHKWPQYKNANALLGDLGSRLGYVTNLPYYCSMSINLFMVLKWWTIIPTQSTAYG